MLSIDAEAVQALPMSEFITAMETMFRNEGSELGSQPMRSAIFPDPQSVIFTMPAYSKKLQRFAVKIVTEFKNNPEKYSLPRQGGIILLIDGNNSQLLASLDAHAVTARRTGAVSGLATQLLSNKDSSRVGIIGSGKEAETLLEAVCAVRDIHRAKVFSKHWENANKFAERIARGKKGLSIEATETSANALKGSDIAIFATNATTPVASWQEVPEGCHINSIGTLPDRRETDEDTICNSKLFVDSKEGVLKEAGDVMQAIRNGRIGKEHISGDLTELVQGICKGRDNHTQVTMFKSVGFALQDVYASSLVYDRIVGSRSPG